MLPSTATAFSCFTVIVGIVDSFIKFIVSACFILFLCSFPDGSMVVAGHDKGIFTSLGDSLLVVKRNLNEGGVTLQCIEDVGSLSRCTCVDSNIVGAVGQVADEL